MSRLMCLSVLLWFGSLLADSPFAQSCRCASAEWYSSERLSGLFVINSCPAWPATIPNSPLPGLSEAVPEMTGHIYLNPSFAAANRDTEKPFYSQDPDNKRQTCAAYPIGMQPTASGWTILLLNHWHSVDDRDRLVRLHDGVISKLSINVLYSVPEIAAQQVITTFRNRGRGRAPTVPGITFVRNPAYYNARTNSSATQNNTYSNIYSRDLINDITRTLESNGWTDFTAGFVRTSDGLFPAIIKRFGQPGRVYASYGRFTDAQAAAQYGYGTETQLYFTKPSIFPNQSTETVQSSVRYGSDIVTSEMQVVANRENFEWFSECRCSDMPYTPDNDGNPVSDAGGNWTPIAPDNIAQNRNLLQFRECPDNIQYGLLYQQCVDRLLGDDDTRANPKDRTDYTDYLASKMGETPAWKSVSPEGRIEDEGLGIDAMPETPAYYDHAGNRLNPVSSDLNDPLAPTTKFYARGFEGGLFGIGEDEVDIEVTRDIRPVMLRMKSLYDSYVSKGRDGLLSLFGLSPDYHGTDLSFSKEALGLELTLRVDDLEYFKQRWQVLNTADKYLPYRSAQVFITQSKTGVPIRVKMRDDNIFTREYQKFDLRWSYDIFVVDQFGDPYKIGSFDVSYYVHYNWDHTDWSDNTRQIKMGGQETMSSSDSYDLKSKEAHTDLKELNERDPESFDKAEAMAKIVYYIAVSEGLDMAMKWVYQQRDKPYIYEAAKRADNMMTTRQSRKLALSLYKGYVEWKRLMDILRDVRDTRRSLERSFTRFKKAGRLLFDYYANLDYSKIRPTNITMLYPGRAIRYFDYSVNSLSYDIRHFEYSAHALAIDMDRFLNGPGKSTVAYMTNEFASFLGSVAGGNDHEREVSHSALQGAMKSIPPDADNTSNYIRLSAITGLAIQKTKQLEIKSLAASTSGLRNVLTAIQSDSRDWITMGDYVTQNIAGTPSAVMQSFNQRTPRPINQTLRVNSIFNNKWVDGQLEDKP
jgi:hypothetical protein